MVASPSGDRLYVTGQSWNNTDNSYAGAAGGLDIATVAYDSATGTQLWVTRYNGPQQHFDQPHAIAVSQDGRHVFVSGIQNWDIINNYELVGDYVTIAYDAETGAQLWATGYQAPGPYPTRCCGVNHTQYSSALALVVSPDGSAVYVTGASGQSPGDGPMEAFTTVAYDAATGAQLWVRRYDAASGNNATGLAIAVSPNGKTVYTTGFGGVGPNHSEVVSFAYDAATGADVWAAHDDYGNSNANVGRSIAISRGGSRIYVSGEEDQQAISQTSNYGVIAYEAGTGTPLWHVIYAAPNSGYNAPFGIALSPDGTRLAVTGRSSGPAEGGVFATFIASYSTLAIDTANGTQRWSAQYLPPTDTFNIARAVAFSPDNSRLYVTGQAGKSLVAGGSDYASVAYDAASGSVLTTLRYNSSSSGNDLDFASALAVENSGATLFVSGGFIYPGGQPNGDHGDFGTLRFDIPAVQLNSVVSRKTHGSAGTFDVNLPLTGPLGIECRSGGTNGDYTLVFTFANTLASVAGASVTSGTGSVSSSNIDSSDAHNYIVNLTGVTNAQVIAVSLSKVTDSAGNASSAVSASMGVLIGDVNASGRVDAADVSLVRQQTLQPVTASNFREDINASGRIDAADVSITRQQTLTSLP
jgi:hypothetical protein